MGSSIVSLLRSHYTTGSTLLDQRSAARAPGRPRTVEPGWQEGLQSGARQPPSISVRGSSGRDRASAGSRFPDVRASGDLNDESAEAFSGAEVDAESPSWTPTTTTGVRCGRSWPLVSVCEPTGRRVPASGRRSLGIASVTASPFKMKGAAFRRK